MNMYILVLRIKWPFAKLNLAFAQNPMLLLIIFTSFGFEML